MLATPPRQGKLFTFASGWWLWLEEPLVRLEPCTHWLRHGSVLTSEWPSHEEVKLVPDATNHGFLQTEASHGLSSSVETPSCALGDSTCLATAAWSICLCTFVPLDFLALTLMGPKASFPHLFSPSFSPGVKDTSETAFLVKENVCVTAEILT